MNEHITLAGWGDMDFNAHMSNTAYLEKCGDSRMLFFASHGFPMSEFKRLGLGPIVFRDELDYKREIGLLETIRVTLDMVGMAPDGSRWVMRNALYRPDGQLASRITSAGGWLDLVERRLVAPPAALLEALNSLPKAQDFQTLSSSIKS